MKIKPLLFCISAICLFYSQSFSQTVKDSTLLGLPGDNLDLYAVLDVFQNSSTIEEFEKSLNLEKTGVNNLDLDLDGKVDFIKVVTKKENDNFSFILQVAVTKKETQDVAVIFVSKDKNKKVTMQVVGDKELYGKDYIVELKESRTPAVTPNPGYKGPDTVFVTQAAKTTTVIVESTPIVQYVYSPAYVPYYPPYYYGYYPPYFAAFTVMAVGMYWGHHAYHHHHHGGYHHGNATVVHNHNTYNNYNKSRNASNTVEHHRQNGDYSGRDHASTRPSGGGANRPSNGTPGSSRPSAGTSDRPAGGNAGSNRPSNGGSGSARPSAGTSDRPAGGNSASTRPSNDASSRPSSGTSDRSSSRQSNGSSRYSGGGGGGFGGGGGGFGGGRGGGGRGGGGRGR